MFTYCKLNRKFEEEAILPYSFMSVPPEGYHFVDLQSSGSVSATAPCPESAVLHLRQEVFGKRTADVVLIAILEIKNHINQANIMNENGLACQSNLKECHLVW